MTAQIAVIGAGFAGMSAACALAQRGYQVTVFEKNAMPGGRARRFEAEGFTFDMGPSWYWMPDVFERFFARFGKQPSDYYTLDRLDPGYRIWFGSGADNRMDVPANMEELEALFESLEPGSAVGLRKFLKEAAYKYEVGMNDLVYKPSQSIFEFADLRVMKGALKLQLFRSFSQHVRKYFKHPRLLQLLEFPVLFLGALPENTPALYSLMNHADLVGGTWYPQGGMFKIVEGMYELALSLGVKFEFEAEVDKVVIENGRATGLQINGKHISADVVLGGADYHHVEQGLLDEESRTYDEKYWDKRVMAPSCLLWYLGVDKKIPSLHHHNLFFDRDFGQHAREIYESPSWPSDPLFYVSRPSATDPTVAPEGKENLFILIPVAPGLEDTEEVRNQYFDKVMTRLEAITGESVRDHIVYNRSFAPTDFKREYHAYKGNAYGLANTLKQTAILKPSLRSKKVTNLYFTGQLTAPGPGVPPALISGQVVADLITKQQAL